MSKFVYDFHALFVFLEHKAEIRLTWVIKSLLWWICISDLCLFLTNILVEVVGDSVQQSRPFVNRISRDAHSIIIFLKMVSPTFF